MIVGHIPLARRFFRHWLWNGEPRVFSKAEAFLDLIQLAAFTRTKKVVGSTLIELEPGQVCGSERYLADRWKWSTKKVRTFLTLLEADKMAAREKKQGITVLTLCNYPDYNNGGSTKEAAKNHKGSSEEAAGKQIEEGKEGEEPKETPPAPNGDKPRSAPKPRISWTPDDGFTGITEDDFIRWAQAYPAVDLSRQIARASEWLLANPKKAKKNFQRFLTGWFDREQERGGNVRGNRPVTLHPPNPLEVRVGRLVGRTAEDHWSDEESAALRALGEIRAADLDMLEDYYTAEIHPSEDHRAQSLSSILANWNREKDKARIWKEENR